MNKLLNKIYKGNDKVHVLLLDFDATNYMHTDLGFVQLYQFQLQISSPIINTNSNDVIEKVIENTNYIVTNSKYFLKQNTNSNVSGGRLPMEKKFWMAILLHSF